MADDINTPAAAASVTASSLVAAPAEMSAPAVTADPVSAQASPEAPVAASTAPETSSTQPATLLSADPEPVIVPEQKPAEQKPADDKPAEGDKPAEAPKEEANQSDKPAPLPAYEPWTLPEGVTLDEKQTSEFSSLLGEFQNSSKAEQALVQKFGQTLVDRHIALVNDNNQRLHEAYQNGWVKQTEGWKDAFVKDPEIGGKRQETTVASANEFIRTHGGTPEQQKDFRDLMTQTGIGNHPAMIRMLANAMTRFNEPKQPAPMHFPAEKQSKTTKWYGKKTG